MSVVIWAISVVIWVISVSCRGVMEEGSMVGRVPSRCPLSNCSAGSVAAHTYMQDPMA